MPFTLGGDWVAKPKHYPPIKIFKEKRKGSYTTLIKNIPLEEPELKLFVSELKKQLATGGSLKEGVVEIQGDKVEEVRALLSAKGWKC